MRRAAAWIVGLLVLSSLMFATERLSSAIGVQTSVEYEEPITVSQGGAEWEESGSFTGFGLGMFGASVVLSIWCGMAVKAGNWTANLPPVDRAQLAIWIAGFVVYGVYGALLARAFRGTHGTLSTALFLALDGAGVLAIAFIGYTLYQRFDPRYR